MVVYTVHIGFVKFYYYIRKVNKNGLLQVRLELTTPA